MIYRCPPFIISLSLEMEGLVVQGHILGLVVDKSLVNQLHRLIRAGSHSLADSLEVIVVKKKSRVFLSRDFCKINIIVLRDGSGTASRGKSQYNKNLFHISTSNFSNFLNNMPLWQLIINGGPILAGIAVKGVFFAKKKMLPAYIRGLKKGWALIGSEEGRKKRVDFEKIPFKRQLFIEAELIYNCIRRFVG